MTKWASMLLNQVPCIEGFFILCNKKKAWFINRSDVSNKYNILNKNNASTPNIEFNVDSSNNYLAVLFFSSGDKQKSL
jgi:hypothetical protein